MPIVEPTTTGNFTLFNELKLSPDELLLDTFQCCSSPGSLLITKIGALLNHLWPGNVQGSLLDCIFRSKKRRTVKS